MSAMRRGQRGNKTDEVVGVGGREESKITPMQLGFPSGC